MVKASRSARPFLIGYHGDKSIKQPWLSPQCYLYTRHDFGSLHPNHRRLLRATDKLYAHECDTPTGSSGSPIFIDLGSGAQVFAINAGTIVYRRYRVNRHTRRRHTTYSHTINVAVGATAFIEGLERFKSETLIAGLADLREIQAHLSKAGLYRAMVDGIYGAGTRLAILKYGKRKGLAQLGMPTAQLLRLLRKQHKPADGLKSNQPLRPALTDILP